MHDLIGGGGMLRGWIAVWTMQMMWILPTMALAVGTAALVELLVSARSARVRVRRPVPASIATPDRAEPPLA
jgi:hypothetical protein